MKVGTIWITGISASGKTTMGLALDSGLRQNGITAIELLDGEAVRSRLSRRYGYSTAERNALSLIIAGMAKQANDTGRVAIVCAISHVKETRVRIRDSMDHFMEVFLDCSPSVAAARDIKGQYAQALRGEIDNFIGVTEPYQVSDKPDLVLPTGRLSATDCGRLLLDAALDFLRAE